MSGWGVTFENAELLPKEGNLEIFFSRRNADGCEDIQNERDEAEQHLVNHVLEIEASTVVE